MTDADHRCPVVVLLSGFGSTLQALIDETQAGRMPVELRAVVSDREDAYGLERAEAAGITTAVVSSAPGSSPEAFDEALADAVDSYDPELVVLAGFMRIVRGAFLDKFEGRALNIHPSLLPKFRGLNTYERVLAAGEREHGSSVHFVTDRLDGGPLILQVKVAILPEDDAKSLSARVQAQERIIYPRVIDWYARGLLAMRGDRVCLDGLVLEAPIVVEATQ